MNIAAVVILYYPDPGLLQRIESYLPYVHKLLVFDNTEEVKEDLSAQFMQLPKITYIADGKNKGISVPLNQAAAYATKDGFDWLLTMDQDSYFPKEMMPAYLECVEHYSDKNETAMFGVQSLSDQGGSRLCIPEEVPHLITSGSIINLTVFKETGRFDEALFIDKVDHEFCLRARSKNFKIVRFNNILLNHNLGTIVYRRSLKNFKRTSRVIHSPTRMYYIFRNYFYLNEKYKNQFPQELKELKRENWLRAKNNFLYGEKRLQLLRYMAKAYFDYKKRKMGKMEN